MPLHKRVYTHACLPVAITYPWLGGWDPGCEQSAFMSPVRGPWGLRTETPTSVLAGAQLHLSRGPGPRAAPAPWTQVFFFLFPSFCTNALMGILENIALKNGARISAWSPLWTALTGGRGALGLLGPHAAPRPQRMASLCPLQGATGPSLCPQSQCDGDSALWWRLQRMCPVGEAGPSGPVLTQTPSLTGGLGVRSLSSLLSVSASRGVEPPPGLGADLPASCIFLRGGVLQWP